MHHSIAARRSTRASSARPAFAAIGLLGALAGVVFHLGPLALTSLLMLSAVALTRWLPWDVALPFGTGASILAATAVGLLAGWLRLPLLSAAAIPLYAAFCLLCVALAVIGDSRVPAEARLRSYWAVPAFLPAAAAVLAGAANALSLQVTSRWFAIVIDSPNHASAITEIRETGVLSYAGNAYPRGFHTLAALCFNAANVPMDLDHQLRAAAALPWLALAVLLACIASLALRTFTMVTLPVRSVCAFLACVLLLASPEFVIQFVLYSASPSLLAAALIMLPVLLVTVHSPSSRWLLWTLPLIGADLVHLWSALTPAVIVPAIAIGCWMLITCRPFPARTYRTLAGVLLSVIVAGLLAWPTMSSLQSVGGVTVAATAGIPKIPSPLIISTAAAGILALAWQAVRRKAFAAIWLAAIVGLLAAAGSLLVGSGHPTELTQWYPMKCLWFSMVLSVPAGVLGVAGWLASAAALVRRRTGHRAPLVNLLGGTVLLTAFALSFGVTIWGMLLWPTVTIPFLPSPDTRISATHPHGLPDKTLAQTSQRTVLIAQEYATRFAPAVTVPIAVSSDPLIDKRDSRMVSTLMGLTTHQRTNSGEVNHVCDQVAYVTGGRRSAVVITALPVQRMAAMLAEDSCAGTRVVQIPWPVDTTNLEAAEKLVKDRAEAAKAASGARS